jgi:hypothetical protein
MDEEGYVPLSLLCTFNRVRELSTDMTLIREVWRMKLFYTTEHVHVCMCWEPGLTMDVISRHLLGLSCWKSRETAYERGVTGTFGFSQENKASPASPTTVSTPALPAGAGEAADETSHASSVVV